VLLFINLSSDREQECFSDGITDDLITALPRLQDLFVIGRASSFNLQRQGGKAAGREQGTGG
jgi:adenylate cyclase